MGLFHLLEGLWSHPAQSHRGVVRLGIEADTLMAAVNGMWIVAESGRRCRLNDNDVSIRLGGDALSFAYSHGVSRFQRGGCEAHLSVVAEKPQLLSARIKVYNHHISQP
jgi:hypothetical protein